MSAPFCVSKSVKLALCKLNEPFSQFLFVLRLHHSAACDKNSFCLPCDILFPLALRLNKAELQISVVAIIGRRFAASCSGVQVKQLLTEGRTATIRGFKSKTGKKFDARIALKKDESGKVIGTIDLNSLYFCNNFKKSF